MVGNRQPEVNIGLVGHVDHGKTTLVQSVERFVDGPAPEEMKRGISIRLGYADATFRYCEGADEPECYTEEEVRTARKASRFDRFVRRRPGSRDP